MLALLLSPLASANMVLDRTVIHFDPEASNREDVRVTNGGEETLYLQVDVFEVRNPGSDAEERVKVTDPRALKLLATPNKMILPPGGRKLIRLVNVGGFDDEERVYRIDVKPIAGPIEAQTTGVKILIAYQLLVIVPPREAAAKLVADRRDGSIEFRNEGNTNLLMFDGAQCAPDAGADCAELEPRRLYAGNRWTVPLPYDTPVEYTITEGDEHRRQQF